MDRIERFIRLIAKRVGLDHVDPGQVRNTSFRGFDQPRITIDAHNPTGRTDSCGRSREQRPAATAHLQNAVPRREAKRVQSPASEPTIDLRLLLQTPLFGLADGAVHLSDGCVRVVGLLDD